MSKSLVFATNNRHKAAEIQQILENQYEILTLNDIGCATDIPETGNTFEENAALKSSYVAMHYGLDCFADDSGLEIEALNNEPGIYSARYSGTRDDHQNLELVLQRMTGISNRKARFKTVISLFFDGNYYLFEGIINGTILFIPEGSSGFGYDPIFQPEGYHQSFAQMSMEEKNRISHRALATAKLIAFLKQQEPLS